VILNLNRLVDGAKCMRAWPWWPSVVQGTRFPSTARGKHSYCSNSSWRGNPCQKMEPWHSYHLFLLAYITGNNSTLNCVQYLAHSSIYLFPMHVYCTQVFFAKHIVHKLKFKNSKNNGTQDSLFFRTAEERTLWSSRLQNNMITGCTVQGICRVPDCPYSLQKSCHG
jgi:hypothetical protein